MIRSVLVSALFSGLIPAALFSQISVPNQPAGAGAGLVMPVLFTPQSDAVSGVQFDLEYDSSVMSVTAVPGDAARQAGKSVYSSDLAPGKKRFIVVALNQTPIPAGTLVTLFVNLNSNAANGRYALTISNAVGTDPDAQPVLSTSADGAVTVQGNAGSRLQSAGVLNAASLLSGPVAPGEIVTLIGSGIGPALSLQPASSASSATLGGASVLFDGRPAPLLFASQNQINAVVPYEVAGQENTQVSVTKGGELVAGFPVSVASAVPAIFTLDASGTGPGAILNQDTTVNSASNPASRGSVVVLFATGAGQTDPPGEDGQTASEILAYSALPVLVQIGGMQAEVLYAGGAPGLIAGVLQINCRVPEGVTPGMSAPVVITVGGIDSPAGVTVAVD